MAYSKSILTIDGQILQLDDSGNSILSSGAIYQMLPVPENLPSRFGAVLPDGIYQFNENGVTEASVLPAGIVMDIAAVDEHANDLYSILTPNGVMLVTNTDYSLLTPYGVFQQAYPATFEAIAALASSSWYKRMRGALFGTPNLAWTPFVRPRYRN